MYINLTITDVLALLWWYIKSTNLAYTVRETCNYTTMAKVSLHTSAVKLGEKIYIPVYCTLFSPRKLTSVFFSLHVYSGVARTWVMPGPSSWSLPVERRAAGISLREARKNFFAFIFQLSGWALVAPSCLTLY